MSIGSFVFMLHSHLPYYRKAGMWPFGEENVYECMAACYIPLLDVVEELYNEGIQAKLTIGITPVLAEQLADEHLNKGFETYLETKIKAVAGDLERFPDPNIPHSQHLEYLAKYYHDWYSQVKDHYINRYNRNLIEAFKKYNDLGCIEVTSSAVTHGFSPLLATETSLNAQFRLGMETHKKLFGKAPRGCWLPECAYRPGYETTDRHGNKTYRPPIEVAMFNNGFEYFFTESHVIEGGVSVGSRRVVGIYGNIEYIPLPSRPPTGLTTYEAYWLQGAQVAVMGRNDRAGFQVWSAAHGYPGDGCFREFHKKDDKSGMNYWRITSPTTDLGQKMLYDPVLASSKIQENSDHYVDLLYHLLNDHKNNTGEEGLVMVSFDTELFGHWWFEGLQWIKAVISKLHNHIPSINRQTASDYLDEHKPSAAVTLPESSWGQGGHFWVWQNHQTEWMWTIIHSAEYRMEDLAEKFKDETDPLKIKALNQVARELVLLQSSDWPFLITTWQARDYATDRFLEHKDNFEKLASMIENNQIDEGFLNYLLDKDNPFDHIDFRVYLKEAVPHLAENSANPVTTGN
jgi:1,4-alpha-glucan branching enzyme